MRSIALSMLLSLALVDVAGAADWPWWRGPLGNGVSPESGLPSTWSAQEGIAWTVPLAGAGVSSPVIAGDRIFVTSQVGRGALKPGQHPLLARNDSEVAKGERAMMDSHAATAPSVDGAAVVFVVEAFDRPTGRRLWQHRMSAEGPLPLVHEKHNLATPSPVTDGERVYAWFGTGQVVALTIDGARVWQRHLAEENGPFTLDWGHGSSPALHGDLLYLLCYHEPASYLVAVDKRSGMTRWKIDRPVRTRSYATPVVVAGPAGSELLVNSTAGLEAYDPATGKLLWQAGGPHSHGIGSPSFYDGVIYTTRGYRSGPYFAVRPGARGGIDASATHVVWRADTGAPYVSSVLVYEGLLYLGSDTGVVTCVDAVTGEKLWQERTGGIFSASPVAGDGKVYFSSETGETFIYASGREPRLIARNAIDGRIVASPAIAGGRLYLRADDRLIAIGGSSVTSKVPPS
ncbi:MAG TPA: PQQ-binding-like beta-propeller repeat protein [Thermoanaerobaculia bacterium]|jgi:outer membrane protein assembly factor BamB|nr:PQQ-binding-like beta-propeller repeat protein [Thermoanaerobaculia bacterium]